MNFEGNHKRKVAIIVFALVALVASSYAIYNFYENNKYAKPEGKLTMGGSTIYRNTIINYCEQEPNQICDAKVLGSDSKYIYAMVVRTGYKGIHTQAATETYQYADDARYVYNNNPLKITGVMYVGDDNSNPSVESIYPRKIYQASLDNWFNTWISQSSLYAKAKQ
jgi:hypothetical protein